MKTRFYPFISDKGICFNQGWTFILGQKLYSYIIKYKGDTQLLVFNLPYFLLLYQGSFSHVNFSIK